MKMADVIKVIAKELGTSDVKEINKVLKSELAVKFRITGKALGHFGFTGHLKSVTEDGVKVFLANKVSLIQLKDIETFEKAKPREERPVKAKTKEDPAKATPAKLSPKAASKTHPADLEDETEDDEESDFADDEGLAEEKPKKLKKSKLKPVGKSGSKFIPSGR